MEQVCRFLYDGCYLMNYNEQYRNNAVRLLTIRFICWFFMLNKFDKLLALLVTATKPFVYSLVVAGISAYGFVMELCLQHLLIISASKRNSARSITRVSQPFALERDSTYSLLVNLCLKKKLCLYHHLSISAFCIAIELCLQASS